MFLTWSAEHIAWIGGCEECREQIADGPANAAKPWQSDSLVEISGPAPVPHADLTAALRIGNCTDVSDKRERNQRSRRAESAPRYTRHVWASTGRFHDPWFGGQSGRFDRGALATDVSEGRHIPKQSTNATEYLTSGKKWPDRFTSMLDASDNGRWDAAEPESRKTSTPGRPDEIVEESDAR
jgi:hypothetical protein